MTRMKIKDAERAIADGTPVAVIPNRYKDDVSGAFRAKVLAVRVARRVYSGARYDFKGHFAYDGVEVELLDGGKTRWGRTYEAGQRMVLAPKDLIQPWESYTTTVAALRDRAAERQAVLDAEKETCQRFVARFGGVVREQTGGSRNATTVGYKVELSSAQAAALLEQP